MKQTNVTSFASYLCPAENQTRGTFHQYLHDFTYILERNELEESLNSIGLAVGTAATIIQFMLTENNHWDRIDSPQTAIAMRMSCYTLRACASRGASLCKRCDEKHADMFYDLARYNLKEQLQNVLNKRLSSLREEFSADDHQPEILVVNERAYLVYACPMLGYREHIFPIFHDNKVVGVLFLGQIKIHTENRLYLDQIERTKKKYFANNPRIFDEYVSEKSISRSDRNRYSAASIRDYILNASRTDFQPKYMPTQPSEYDSCNPFFTDSIQLEDYEKMLIKVDKQLGDFEVYLNKRDIEERENFIRRCVDVHIKHFRNEDLKTDYDDLRGMWKHIEETITQIAMDCDLAGIAVFGSNSVSQKNDRYLRVVCGYGSLDKQKVNQSESNYFSLGFLNSDNRKHINSDEDASLFQYMPESFQAQTDRKYCLFLPANRLPSASIAVLFDFADRQGKELIANSLGNAMMITLTSISSRLAELFENTTQKYLEKVLRMYMHEMTHLTNGMLLPIDYLGRKNLKKIDDGKIKNIYDDARDTINMVGFMAVNIEALLNESFIPVKENFNIFKRLLYKWENIFRKDAHANDKDFSFLSTILDIRSDPRFVELVVYNLFSNAVKYAYRGSKIYFDCVRDKNTGNVVLTITNYAGEIPQETLDEMFEFGVSYKGPYAEHTSGSGIGLFIVKQIMRKLGGSVLVKQPRFICAYNVPMLYAFINRTEFQSTVQYKDAQEEYNRLEKMNIQNLFGNAVNGLELVITNDFRKMNFEKVDKGDILLWLNMATYEIQFEVVFDAGDSNV